MFKKRLPAVCCEGKIVTLRVMRIYVIAGEASGDLHAGRLMEAVRRMDAGVEIRYWYRPDLAYMGIVPVVLHIGEILRGMRECKEDIMAFRPDCLVLVDYPGFNMKIASWFHANFVAKADPREGNRPGIVYYIPPKIWAWKEKRIKGLRRHMDMILSILPFEVDWYREKYGCHVDYVGNPTLDETDEFLRSLSPDEVMEWKHSLGVGEKKIVALMPGSRRQEISRNLPMMLRAARKEGKGYAFVIASAPNVEESFYRRIISGETGVEDDGFAADVKLASCTGSRSSFLLLHSAHAAMVTSGTATLETAIMGVPQVVCYAMAFGKLMSWLRRMIIKVPFVSLVNLIAGYEVVPELIAGEMTQERVNRNLRRLLGDEDFRRRQQEGYGLMRNRLGNPGAPVEAARKIVMKGK